MHNIFDLLSANSYPGRGIVIGTTKDGLNSVVAYFIMGRSQNSRNRIFVPAENGGLKTEAHDASLMTDPSLIIYSPVLCFEGATIVTNGNQTDTIYEHLTNNESFESALRTREFEPDMPNYTPRVSGILQPDGSYKLSILKTTDGESCLRFFFEYPLLPGQGHFICTYTGDGDPLPSFASEPITVSIEDEFSFWAGKLWESLDHDNKVSLLVRSIPLNGDEPETIIFNKNTGD